MNNNLEALRENNFLTKKKLAAQLGVSDSIYARWEKGKDIIPTKRLWEIANYYHINTDYILGLTTIKKEVLSNHEIDRKLISKRAKEIRQDTGMSLKEFTKLLNTSPSTWNAYETGKVIILGAFLYEICKEYNISSDYLLGRSNIKYR